MITARFPQFNRRYPIQLQATETSDIMHTITYHLYILFRNSGSSEPSHMPVRLPRQILAHDYSQDNYLGVDIIEDLAIGEVQTIANLDRPELKIVCFLNNSITASVFCAYILSSRAWHAYGCSRHTSNLHG